MKPTVGVESVRWRTEGLNDLLHFVLQQKDKMVFGPRTDLFYLFRVVTSLSCSDLVVTAAAQVVSPGGVRGGCRRRRRHFLRHAGMVRRLFEHVVQAAVRPVVGGRLQPQQV